MSTTLVRGSVPTLLPTTFAPAWTMLRRWLGRLDTAFDVAAERRRLAALDERMLKDIGLSRSLAARETSRDFFDLPESRMQRR